MEENPGKDTLRNQLKIRSIHPELVNSLLSLNMEDEDFFAHLISKDFAEKFYK